MSCLKQRIEARRVLPSASPPSPPPVTLAVRRASRHSQSVRVESPRPGLLRILGAPFLEHPTGPTARRFLERAFGAPEVESVCIDAERGLAEIRFAPSRGDPRAQVVELARGIAGNHQPARSVTLPDTLGRGCRSRVRLQRYGHTLSGWSVKHEIEGRIRFENPVLLRRRALRQAIEAEFTNAFGIDRFSVQELTGTVLVHFNRRQIQKRQIVGLLDVVGAMLTLSSNTSPPLTSSDRLADEPSICFVHPPCDPFAEQSPLPEPMPISEALNVCLYSAHSGVSFGVNTPELKVCVPGRIACT